MRIGIFADTHDHLDNIRRAVNLFNEQECELVLFAGDLVSTFAVPPLRALRCPVWGCFGDNEGNKTGLLGGFRVLGRLGDPPVEYLLHDGTRVKMAHLPGQLRSGTEDYDIGVHGHTHQPFIRIDDRNRLIINPGETSGWTYGRPTVALLETTSRTAEILPLDTSIPLPSWDESRRAPRKPG